MSKVCSLAKGFAPRRSGSVTRRLVRLASAALAAISRHCP